MSEEHTETDDDSNGFTEETSVRIKWLGSVVSAFVIVSFFGLVYAVSFEMATLAALNAPVTTVLVLLVLAAGTWTFGIDLIDKYAGNK